MPLEVFRGSSAGSGSRAKTSYKRSVLDGGIWNSTWGPRLLVRALFMQVVELEFQVCSVLHASRIELARGPGISCYGVPGVALQTTLWRRTRPLGGSSASLLGEARPQQPGVSSHSKHCSSPGIAYSDSSVSHVGLDTPLQQLLFFAIAFEVH